MASCTSSPASSRVLWPCKETPLLRVASSCRAAGQQRLVSSQHQLSKSDHLLVTRALDESSSPILVSSQELNDGSVMFSFGDEAEAKAKSAAAPSRNDNNKSIAPASQQQVQGAPQASQEQSQLPGATTKSPKQASSSSSVPDLQQHPSKAPRPLTASRATQAAAPAIDPKVIAKYTRLAVIPNLPVSGSTGPSSSSFDASQSVSSVPTQRPSSPAIVIAALSNSAVGPGKTGSKGPSQGPGQKAKPAIDPKIIAKYSHRAVTATVPSSGSTGPSISSAHKSGSNTSSQRPSVPAVASASNSNSSSGVESSKLVSQVPSQKPGSPKPAIDPAVIAKYSRRAIIPALPPSAASPRTLSSDASRWASTVSSQRPSLPAAASASPSMSTGDAMKSVSKAPTQSPQSPAVAVPSPSSSGDDASKPDSKAPLQRPRSPASASYSLSSLGLDDSSMSSSQGPRQRPASPKPPIDPAVIAKYSRRAVTLGPPVSRSEVAQVESRPASADTSDEKASSSEAASERLGDMTPQQLQGLKVVELKALCKQERITGYSKLKKDQLISRLREQLQIDRG